MCIGKQICSEVGNDPSRWDRRALLKPPTWFAQEALPQLALAIQLASVGSLKESRDALATTRADEMRDYLLEHGRETGKSRLRIQNIKSRKGASTPGVIKDPVRGISPSLASAVWGRDHYICRYCGTRVIAPSVLVAYSRLSGSDAFWIGRPVNRRHGTVLAFRAYVDHVVPHAKGGLTDANNLVTACWSCNYGKRSYDLVSLMLDDPGSRAVPDSSWQGLTEYLDGLQAGERRKKFEVLSQGS